MMKSILMNRQKISVYNFVLSYGFYIVLFLVFIYFSVFTRNFLTISNIINLMNASAPLLIVTSGLALVIMTRKLDISIGSISFVTTAIGSAFMVRHDVPPAIALLMIIAAGMMFGALNGFIIVILNVNSFIATLGTMFALRGLALQVTKGRIISAPEILNNIGKIKIGPIYLNILISFAFILFIHLIHVHTRFGRYIIAIGNEPEVALKMGIRVERITFTTFVLSGLLASISGIISMLQLGGVTSFMGIGLEFTGIASIVIGGISLFGGEGSIIPGLLSGVYTLSIIENGLNLAGASPYIYPFVRGGIIFIAMYADSLRSKSLMRV